MRDLLCVVGPTASGKTALAVRLAEAYGGEVISCDSVQIYRGFDIGSAKPTPEERRGVPHHMLDVADPGESFSAGRYAREASACVEDIASRGRLPIVCGGAGLYLKALGGGLADIPDAPRLDHGPGAWEKLRAADPETAARLRPGDRQRVARALDVYAATGLPLSHYHGQKTEPRYRLRCVGLLPFPARRLRARIEDRARRMMERGLPEETAALLASGVPRDCPPMRTIGYRQAAALLAGALTRQEALDDMIQATRKYAKRQITWFRGQANVLWMDISEENFCCFPKKMLEKFFNYVIL